MVKSKNGLILIMGIAIAAMLFFNMKQCGTSNDLRDAIEASQQETRTYKDKNGELVYYNSAIVVENRDLKLFNDSLAETVKDMKIKKPEVIIKTISILRIDTVTKVFRDSLPCDDFVKNDTIERIFYRINYTLTKDSITFNEIYIPNEQTIVVGEKKNGIFKKNEYVVAIKNSNPLVIQEDIEPYIIKPKGKLFQDGIKVGVGVLVGILIARLASK